MSTQTMIIEERARKIGNFWVGRLLPFREKRMIGPFIYIDHMGPVELKAGQHFDVPPHPHIGLSTLTYLIEGHVMHRDSLGTVQEIAPGSVNWMTAGKGIVHSERTPDHLRGQAMRMHGLQIWVALPAALEDMQPAFSHIPAEDIPAWEEGGLSFRLVAGKLAGYESKVPVHSPLYMLEIRAEREAEVHLADRLYGEAGLYVLSGCVHTEGEDFGEKLLLVTDDARLCSFRMTAQTVVYIFGGEPFPEHRYIDWNFVSSIKSKIDQARQAWATGDFHSIAGETEQIAMPARPAGWKW
ncbi:MAG: pirin family protein [Bacteroidia bacterium]